MEANQEVLPGPVGTNLHPDAVSLAEPEVRVVGLGQNDPERARQLLRCVVENLHGLTVCWGTDLLSDGGTPCEATPQAGRTEEFVGFDHPVPGSLDGFPPD